MWQKMTHYMTSCDFLDVNMCQYQWCNLYSSLCCVGLADPLAALDHMLHLIQQVHAIESTDTVRSSDSWDDLPEHGCCAGEVKSGSCANASCRWQHVQPLSSKYATSLLVVSIVRLDGAMSNGNDGLQARCAITKHVVTSMG